MKDIRRKTQAKSKDPLLSVMMMCKETMTDFVRTVTGAPDYMVILSSDHTLDNLVRFCAYPMSPSVLTFDPTFSLGQFDVTVTTYKHPLLVFRNPREHSSCHPNLIGPILIHQRKQFSNYHYFTSTLVGLRPSLRNLTAFGTDGEAALVQACVSQFPTAIHLRCWLHLKDNIKNKLECSLKLPRNVAQEFIADILGKASSLEKGLVDADDEDDYLVQLQSLKKVWDEREHKVTNDDPVFHTWFQQHCAEVVKKTMLKSVRQSAGLGLPPSPYYTNAVESMNSLLKLRTNHKKQDLTMFITKMKELIESQFIDVDRAIAGVGDYEVASEYPNFQFDPSRWCALSEKQRKRVLQQFTSAKPVPIASSKDGFTSADSVEISSHNNPLVSLDITDYVADVIWTNANDLLQADSNFVTAPGKATQSWLVARSSNSTEKPYFVRIQKGHYECESNCFYYVTCKVCAHIVAIAKKNGDLDGFISWHKQHNHGINATDLAQSGLPKSSIGKKNAPRKGVSKKKSAKIRKMCADSDESSWQSRISIPITTCTQTQSVPRPPTTTCTSNSLPSTQTIASTTSASAPVLPSSPSPLVHVWPNVYTYAMPQTDQFVLTFIRGNISICYGCKQHYVKPVIPPNDLCIMHQEWRTYTIPGSPSPQTKFGNAYYHPNIPCITVQVATV